MKRLQSGVQRLKTGELFPSVKRLQSGVHRLKTEQLYLGFSNLSFAVTGDKSICIVKKLSFEGQFWKEKKREPDSL